MKTLGSLLVLALAVVLIAADSTLGASDPVKSSAPVKKILVELYTSQGCDSCPPASDLLGKLEKLGYGPQRVVVVNFHVDYFNHPWADPYSDSAYSRRQRSYNDVQRRDDLYFTPLMMVDGRFPLLGSDQAKALSALGEARKDPPGVALDLDLKGAGLKKTLAVKVSAAIKSAAGRELLVGVALTEDPVTTKVGTGENAGRTLVEHQVVRRFAHKFTTPARTEAANLTFPVELDAHWDAQKFRVSVFVQDRLNGVVYQADSLPWVSTSAPSIQRTRDLQSLVAKRKAKHAQAIRISARVFSDFSSGMGHMAGMNSMSGSSDNSAGNSQFFPDFGTQFPVQTLFSPPSGIDLSHRCNRVANPILQGLVAFPEGRV